MPPWPPNTALVPQLTCDDLLQLQPSLQAYLDRFRPLFPRRDQGTSFAAYAKGLLSGLLVDTTDMPKQGVHSVGVARQYCGRLGQVANCQAVFVAYAGEGRATLVHRRLFLTEAWTGDEAYAERRQRCSVSADATF